MKAHSRPKIGQRDKWEEWERFCLQCLRLALKRMRSKATLPEWENELNSCLFDELRIAARKLCSKGSYPPIRSECPVQPFGASDESHRRLKASPDITWGYEDDREPNALKSTRDFVIECKRVRSPTSSGWVFTAHYVTDGISRFRDTSKRYAEGVVSAVMVGYWQNGLAPSLQTEINSAAQTAGFSHLTPSLGVKRSTKILEFNHSFTRPFPVSPFRLSHLWIEICK